MLHGSHAHLGLLEVFFHEADDGAADDDPVGVGGQRHSLLGPGDAETHSQGLVGELSQFVEVGDEFGRKGVAAPVVPTTLTQ